MLTGFKGQERPVHVIGNIVKILSIVIGEEEENLDDGVKNTAAKALGAKGEIAQAESMTPERHAEIGRKAARSCWNIKG